MSSLLSRIAPPCSAAAPKSEEQEEQESLLEEHPALALTGALFLSGVGMVGAVGGAVTAVTVPLCLLLGLI